MSTERRGTVAFLVLVFGLAWASWEVPLRLGVPVNGNLFQLFVLPGAFAPAIAAIAVRKWVTREGFADAGLRLNVRKWPYYVAAWLIPVTVIVFDCVAAPAFGIGNPDYALHDRTLLPTLGGGGNALQRAVLQLTVYSIVTAPVLWGEEFGWRSYLQIRIFRSRPLAAAISTGLIWGIWHFPLLLRGSEFPAHPVLSLVIFPVGTVLYSILFGWLRVKSGSIWASSFAHSAINHLAVPLRGLLFASLTDSLPLALLGFVPLVIFSLVIIVGGGLKPVSEAR